MKGSKLALLSIMAAAIAGEGYTSGIYDEPRHVHYKPKTKEQIEAEKIAQYKRHGLKEWTINGCVVWAATKKAAIKKSTK